MRIVLLVPFVSVAFAVSAQRGDSAAQQQALADQIASAQAAAEANASRPGDENLSCEALQAEMAAIAQSPEMQAFTQTAGAQAQANLAQINAAQAQQQAAAQARPGMARQIAQGVVSGVVPGVKGHRGWTGKIPNAEMSMVRVSNLESGSWNIKN